MTATPAPSANERLKLRAREITGGSLIAAVVIHMLVFQMWPPISVDDWTKDGAPDLTVIDVPNVPLPAPPEAIRRPARPVIAAGVDVTATVDVVPFADAAKAPPPPPPDPAAQGQGRSAFVVYDVAPRLLNPEDLERALARAYPAMLRDAGIGGVVSLQIYIDAEGRALDARVSVGSGYPALDRAALGLIDSMRFSPAQNRDRKVPVWVQIPIEFRTRS